MPFSFARLADYFAAVAAVGAEGDAARQQALAALLGLVERTQGIRTAKLIEADERESRPASATDDATAKRQVAAPRSPEGTEDRRGSSDTRLSLRLVAGARRSPPEWIHEVVPLPRPGTAAAPPAPQPLFNRQWSRAILSTALAVPAEIDQPDVDAIVRSLVRGTPMPYVPRRRIPTLARGVQVLVDRGPTSAPFHHDQQVLTEQILAIAGRDRVQILRFDPSNDFAAGIGPRRNWTDYFARWRPLRQVPIVLLSDLGLASLPLHEGVAQSTWLAFLCRLAALGNEIVAFVPYGPARWPPPLRRHLHLIAWDRQTKVQTVKRYLRQRRGAR